MCKSFFNYLELLLNLGVEQVNIPRHVEAVNRLHLSLDELEALPRKLGRKKRGKSSGVKKGPLMRSIGALR